MRVCMAQQQANPQQTATMGPAGGERKLRMLCLHGYLQNAEIFRNRIGSVRKALKSRAEFVFVSAPHEAHAADADEAREAAGAMDGRTWWRWKDDTVPGTRPSRASEYSHWQDSYDVLLAALEEHAPIDVLFGFSQGAAATALLLSHMHREQHPLLQGIRGAVMIGGFMPRDPSYAAVVDAHAPGSLIPTFHVYGANDQLVPPDRSSELAAVFERATAAAMGAVAAAGERAGAAAGAEAGAAAGVDGVDGGDHSLAQRYEHPGAHMVPTCTGDFRQALTAFLVDSAALPLRSLPGSSASLASTAAAADGRSSGGNEAAAGGEATAAGGEAAAAADVAKQVEARLKVSA